MDYRRIPNRGIVGHNNEVFMGRSPEECQELCCARDWCRSFDYLPPNAPTGQCALADVDVSVMQATNNEYGSDIYERVHQAPPPPPPEGAEGCAAELTSKSDDINHLCCPHGGCERGTPDTCSEECDTVWMPFSKRCSMWLESMGADSGAGASMAQVTELCENSECKCSSSLAGSLTSLTRSLHRRPFQHACVGKQPRAMRRR